MSWIPKQTVLGNLRLLETYDYFDGPRLFAARNAVGTTFLALWADELPDTDNWFYVPVSDERLASVREGTLPIRDAFLASEDGVVYSILQPKEGGAPQVKLLNSGELPIDCLPPEEDRIELGAFTDASIVTVASEEEPEWTRHRSVQRVSISRGGRLPPPLSVVTDVLGKWQSLFEEALRQMGGRANMLPIRATPGSFLIDLAISDPPAAAAAFRLVSEAIRVGVGSELGDEQSAKFPVAIYRQLLRAVSDGEVAVRVTMSGAAEGDEIVLAPEQAMNVRLTMSKDIKDHLASEQVPQADDLLKVFRVLELTATGREITARLLGVVHRQVNYYKHAARVLGYLDDDNELTAAGRQSLRLSADERLVSAAVQFENSACGGAWVSWSGVASLAGVSAESAEKFLVALSDLSPTTASRRALTLRSWLETVLPYHYSRWYKPKSR